MTSHNFHIFKNPLDPSSHFLLLKPLKRRHKVLGPLPKTVTSFMDDPLSNLVLTQRQNLINYNSFDNKSPVLVFSSHIEEEDKKETMRKKTTSRHMFQRHQFKLLYISF